MAEKKKEDDDVLVGREVNEFDPILYKTFLFLQKNKNKDMSSRIKTKKDMLEYIAFIIKKICENCTVRTHYEDLFFLINTGEKSFSMAWNIILSFFNGKLRNDIDDDNYILQSMLCFHNENVYIAIIYIPIPQNVNIETDEDEGKFLYEELKDANDYDKLKNYIRNKFNHNY